MYCDDIASAGRAHVVCSMSQSLSGYGISCNIPNDGFVNTLLL